MNPDYPLKEGAIVQPMIDEMVERNRRPAPAGQSTALPVAELNPDGSAASSAAEDESGAVID